MPVGLTKTRACARVRCVLRAGMALSLAAIPAGASEWTADRDDVWGLAGNWSGGVPDGAGAAADFLSRIHAARAVTVDGDYTLGSLTLRCDYQYTIGGLGSVSLNNGADPAPAATLSVSGSAGSPRTSLHSISAGLSISGKTDWLIAGGMTLDLPGQVEIGPSILVTKKSATGNDGLGTARLSGSLSMRDGAQLKIDAGALELALAGSTTLGNSAVFNIGSAGTLTASSAADPFTDSLTNSRHASITNSGNFNVTAGAKFIESLSGTGCTTVSAGAALDLNSLSMTHSGGSAIVLNAGVTPALLNLRGGLTFLAGTSTAVTATMISASGTGTSPAIDLCGGTRTLSVEDNPNAATDLSISVPIRNGQIIHSGGATAGAVSYAALNLSGFTGASGAGPASLTGDTVISGDVVWNSSSALSITGATTIGGTMYVNGGGGSGSVFVGTANRSILAAGQFASDIRLADGTRLDLSLSAIGSRYDIAQRITVLGGLADPRIAIFRDGGSGSLAVNLTGICLADSSVLRMAQTNTDARASLTLAGNARYVQSVGSIECVDLINVTSDVPGAARALTIGDPAVSQAMDVYVYGTISPDVSLQLAKGNITFAQGACLAGSISTNSIIAGVIRFEPGSAIADAGVVNYSASNTARGLVINAGKDGSDFLSGGTINASNGKTIAAMVSPVSSGTVRLNRIGTAIAVADSISGADVLLTADRPTGTSGTDGVVRYGNIRPAPNATVSLLRSNNTSVIADFVLTGAGSATAWNSGGVAGIYLGNISGEGGGDDATLFYGNSASNLLVGTISHANVQTAAGTSNLSLTTFATATNPPLNGGNPQSFAFGPGGRLTITTGTTTLASGIQPGAGGTFVVSGGTLTLNASAQSAITHESGTINIKAPQTVATLTLNSAAPLNLNGYPLTASAISGNEGITNNGAADVLLTIANDTDCAYAGAISDGTHKIALSKSGLGRLTLTGSHAYTGGTSVASGTLEIQGRIPGQSLVIEDQGAVVLTSAGTSNTLRDLAMNGSGSLDLGDNSLIVQKSSQTERDAALLYLIDRLHQGTLKSAIEERPADPRYPWAGLGIGVLNSTSVLVKLTWKGDADLDGSVGADDYFLIDQGYRLSAPGQALYCDGDVDYSRTIDADDYYLIDSSFMHQSGALAAAHATSHVALPEPSAAATLAVFAGVLLRRRRVAQ